MRKRDDIDRKIRAMERALREDPWRYEPRPIASDVYTIASASSHTHSINPTASVLTVGSASPGVIYASPAGSMTYSINTGSLSGSTTYNTTTTNP